MSEEQLKDLLGELVDEVPRPAADRVDAAWSSGRRRRRRGGALVAAGTVAVLLAGTGVVVATRPGDGDPGPSDRTPRPSPTAPEDTAPSSRPRDATYRGAPVWWAPDQADESRLDTFDSVLPPTVELSPDLPQVEPGQSALGLFTVMDADGGGPVRIVVLTPDGSTAELPADRVEAHRDQGGNGAALTPPNGGLSPDGRHAFFAQRSSIELYDFETGEWRTIDTPDGVAAGARWLDDELIWVPNGVALSGVGTTYDADGRLLDPEVPRIFSDLDLAAADEPYGVWVDGPRGWAGSYYFAGPVRGGAYDNPEGIVARIGNDTSVLAVSIMDGRYKMCCPVVGWLTDDVVAFESNSRVLAWQVGTGTVYRVTDLVGLDLEQEWLATSWAWRALD